jgi:cell envelope opacity-associated protein A
MIKTDYKTKGTNKSLFSSSRKRSSLPVIIMAVIAFSLALWGLWAKLNEQASSQNNLTPISTTTNSVEEITTIESSDVDSKSNLQEIQLEFQHDKKSTPTIKLKETTIPKDKPKQIDNKPTKEPTKEVTKVIQKENVNWQLTKIRSGDSMARLFQRLGLSATD